MLETMHCYELQIISIYPKAPKIKLVNHISDVKRSFSKPQYSKNSVKAPSSLSFFHNYFHSFLFIVYSKALSGLVNKRPFLSNGQEEFLGTRQVLEHFVAESNSISTSQTFCSKDRMPWQGEFIPFTSLQVKRQT